MPPACWNLVLAAGSGRRLTSVTGGVPKQFWRPYRGASLLEDTLERLAPIAPARRTVTVVDRSHRPFVEAMDSPLRLGTVLYQPADRGTAAGVLLGLKTVLTSDPNALVIMTPSDHGVVSGSTFRAGIRLALNEVKESGSEVVLFGIEPDRPYADYGWITPARAVSPWTLSPVGAFVEKPPAAAAMTLYESGAVWNTMVLVARASALANLYERHLPELYAALADAPAAAGVDQQRLLDATYDVLPRYDFSRDLLTRAANLAVMVWPETMGWSDLGTPDRWQDWTASHRIGIDATLDKRSGAWAQREVAETYPSGL